MPPTAVPWVVPELAALLVDKLAEDEYKDRLLHVSQLREPARTEFSNTIPFEPSHQVFDSQISLIVMLSLHSITTLREQTVPLRDNDKITVFTVPPFESAVERQRRRISGSEKTIAVKNYYAQGSPDVKYNVRFEAPPAYLVPYFHDLPELPGQPRYPQGCRGLNGYGVFLRCLQGICGLDLSIRPLRAARPVDASDLRTSPALVEHWRNIRLIMVHHEFLLTRESDDLYLQLNRHDIKILQILLEQGSEVLGQAGTKGIAEAAALEECKWRLWAHYAGKADVQEAWNLDQRHSIHARGVDGIWRQVITKHMGSRAIATLAEENLASYEEASEFVETLLQHVVPQAEELRARSLAKSSPSSRYWPKDRRLLL